MVTLVPMYCGRACAACRASGRKHGSAPRGRPLLRVAVTFWLLVLCVVTPGWLAAGTLPDPSPGLATLDFRVVVNSAKDEVFPAVVFIKCIREDHTMGERKFEEMAGSGVIISPEGEVLTNWHVVEKAVEVRCLLLDGRPMDAEVLGTDKDLDLALLRLQIPEGADPIRYACIGDSGRLREGDFVMAMGAPWGLARSVSIGIIACTKRYLPDYSEYSLWLQTDASICPGNSGGPLVNTDGQVVGINTLAALIGGDLGFAVPSETIRHVLPQLREHGRVDWSWTGLQLQPLKDFSKNIYFEGTEGVMVAGTDPESPARHAGMQHLDRLLRVGGEPVNAITEEDLPAVRRLLGLLPKDQPVAIDLLRNGELTTIEITPGAKGRVEGEELDCPRWDLTVKAINKFDNPDLHFFRTEGVFVFGTKHPGNAEAAGLRERDIILTIDGVEVKTLEDVKAVHAAALENVEAKHRMVFTVMRNGLMRQFALDFLRDYKRQ